MNNEKIKQMFVNNILKISTETLGWIATIAFHLTTIPTLLSLVAGINDRVPTSEMLIFVWVGLIVLMLKSLIQKDYINIILNSFGFFVQACLFSLIVFK
jgi:hypothetical protein